MARKWGVLWTSGTFFIFVPYAVLYMLASLCLSAIFKNQAIMMPSWFRQWYRQWNWMAGYDYVLRLRCKIEPLLAGLGLFFIPYSQQSLAVTLRFIEQLHTHMLYYRLVSLALLNITNSRCILVELARWCRLQTHFFFSFFKLHTKPRPWLRVFGHN